MASHEELVEEMVNQRVWAVVGASNNPKKFGNKIYRNLKAAGYTVYPVNPNVSEIGGETVYPTLASLPQRPAVVDIVVPPPVTEQIVRQVHDLGITNVWMQPGAESQEAIDYCNKNGIHVVYHDCAMIRRKEWGDDGKPRERDMEGVACPLPGH